MCTYVHVSTCTYTCRLSHSMTMKAVCLFVYFLFTFLLFYYVLNYGTVYQFVSFVCASSCQHVLRLALFPFLSNLLLS